MYQSLETQNVRNLLKPYAAKAGPDIAVAWQYEQRLDWLNGLILGDAQTQLVVNEQSGNRAEFEVIDGEQRLRLLYDAFVSDEQPFAYDIESKSFVCPRDLPTEISGRALCVTVEFLRKERLFELMVKTGDLQESLIDDLHNVTRVLLDAKIPLTRVIDASPAALRRQRRNLNASRLVSSV